MRAVLVLAVLVLALGGANLPPPFAVFTDRDKPGQVGLQLVQLDRLQVNYRKPDSAKQAGQTTPPKAQSK